MKSYLSSLFLLVALCIACADKLWLRLWRALAIPWPSLKLNKDCMPNGVLALVILCLVFVAMQQGHRLFT